MFIKERVTRVDPSIILDIFTGVDSSGRNTLILLSKEIPTYEIKKYLVSSNLINISLAILEDQQTYKVSASLINSEYIELFNAFVGDVIKAARRLNDKAKGLSFFAKRYFAWKRMFSGAKNNKLSDIEIKGLIGELLFLKNYMFKHYSLDEACNAWIGNEYSDHDFYASDYWYEVKTTTSGNPMIKISSLEQLDSEREGYLCIISLDKTSNMDNEAILLNSLVADISKLIGDNPAIEEFEEKLLSVGYQCLLEYDNYPYHLGPSMSYLVNKDFPVLRRSDIAHAEIVNANYTLDVSSIIPSERGIV